MEWRVRRGEGKCRHGWPLAGKGRRLSGGIRLRSGRWPGQPWHRPDGRFDRAASPSWSMCLNSAYQSGPCWFLPSGRLPASFESFPLSCSATPITSSAVAASHSFRLRVTSRPLIRSRSLLTSWTACRLRAFASASALSLCARRSSRWTCTSAPITSTSRRRSSLSACCFAALRVPPRSTIAASASARLEGQTRRNRHLVRGFASESSLLGAIWGAGPLPRVRRAA